MNTCDSGKSHSLIQAVKEQSHELGLLMGNLAVAGFSSKCYQVIMLSSQEASAAPLHSGLFLFHSPAFEQCYLHNLTMPAIQREINTLLVHNNKFIFCFQQSTQTLKIWHLVVQSASTKAAALKHASKYPTLHCSFYSGYLGSPTAPDKSLPR